MSCSIGMSSNIQVAPSLDVKHDQMLERFRHLEETVIPKLESEYNTLKTQVDEGEIAKTSEVRLKLQNMGNKLKRLKKEKSTYFLENSKYIFDYFEEKQKINSGDQKRTNDGLMNSFFRIKSTKKEASGTNHSRYNTSRQLYQKYWKNINEETILVRDFTIEHENCRFCNKGELIAQEDEGVLICNNRECGRFVRHIVDSSKPSNKDPPNEVSYTAYIRLNHFKEILAQFQAKETTQIPDEIIEMIRNRIKKERITDLSTLDYNKMREILRKLGLNKYFEHIQYINSIFGIKPPVMDSDLHETLCVLFIEIQRPWALHCPPTRTNFFNYTYTLYQLCVLLDQTQYLPYIPMMKDREKQLEQDMIWKKVCFDLDWEYFPTV